MAQVWRVRDCHAVRQQPRRGPETHFALKIMRHPQSTTTSAYLRFQQEAEVLTKLQEAVPNIVSIIDRGEIREEGGTHIDRARLFFVMPLYPTTLAREAEARAGDLDFALSRVIQVAGILAEVHKSGVIHRDIKPANILLDGDGQTPVLADFGICLLESEDRLTHDANGTLGTEHFAAPELAGGGLIDDVTPAADVYSLGKTLYSALIGGSDTFPGSSHRLPRFDLVRRFSDSRFSHVNGALDALTADEAEVRPQSMQEVVLLLQRVRVAISDGAPYVDGMYAERLQARRAAAEAAALESLVEAPDVRAARELLDAIDSAETGHKSEAAATLPTRGDALLALAAALENTHRSAEAVRTLGAAARFFESVGDLESSLTAARSAYHQALVVRRDARLAERLSLGALATPAGLQASTLSNDDEVTYLAALAEILSGVPIPAPAIIAHWDRPTTAEDLNGENTPALESGEAQALVAKDAVVALHDSSNESLRWYRAARLRAEHSLTCLENSAAAAALLRAARFAPTEGERAECQIRAALAGGTVAGGTSHARAMARTTLQELVVPADLEGMRIRAHAWLAALDGDLDSAANDFSNEALRALRRRDAVGAAAAYRSAEWAWHQRPDVMVVMGNPGVSASRLENSAARHPDATRVSTHELLDEAKYQLHERADAHEAWRVAAAAVRLAYDDVDPGNLHRARRVIADVWERVIDDSDAAVADEASLFQAIHYSTLVHQDLDDVARARRAEVLRHALSTRVSTDLRRRLLSNIVAVPSTRVEWVGALALLRGLSPVLTADDVNEIAVPALRSGLAFGWGGSRQTNAALAACDLFHDVAGRVEPLPAALVRDDLAHLESQTSKVFREHLYGALALATDVGSPPSDGGKALADQLLSTLVNVRALPPQKAVEFRDALGMALAALAARAEPSLAASLTTVLVEEAGERFRAGLAVRAVSGSSVPTETLDAYLVEQTDRIRLLTCAADPSFFAFVPGDDWRLTQRASKDASESVRHDAISAVVALLNEDRQREMVRALWVSFAAQLARGTPERRTEVVLALARIASGQFSASGVRPLFDSHPLGAVRIKGLHDGSLPAKAAHALGTLWGPSGTDERNVIKASLITALLNSAPAVRVGAVRGLAETLTSDPSLPNSARWQVDVLISALADPIAAVHGAARTALADLPRPQNFPQ